MQNKNTKKGYIALVAVLIATALTLAVSIGASLRSISGTYLGFAYVQAYQARELTSSCVDIALLRLKKDLDYVGNEDIIIEGNTCHIYTITGTGNENRNIRVSAFANDFVKRAEVHVLRVSPITNIASWGEVSDF